MMKIWVTGAQGLLGSYLRKKACWATGRELDIGDESAVDRFVCARPDMTHIINCAAFSLVDAAEEKQEEAFQANALGPEHLGRAAAKIGAKVIHLSTDYVFPGTGQRPLKEDDPADPQSVYGKTKWEGEKRLLQAAPDACIIRTSWIFGHGGKNFVARLLHLLQTQEEIRLTKDHWNLPTYAPDLADAILKMADASGIYHFANREAASKYEFGLAMRQWALEAGLSIAAQRILPVLGASFPLAAKRPVYSVFDLSKTERLLQSPIRSWKEALREFLTEAHGKIS